MPVIQHKLTRNLALPDRPACRIDIGVEFVALGISRYDKRQTIAERGIVGVDRLRDGFAVAVDEAGQPIFERIITGEAAHEIAVTNACASKDKLAFGIQERARVFPADRKQAFAEVLSDGGEIAADHAPGFRQYAVLIVIGIRRKYIHIILYPAEFDISRLRDEFACPVDKSPLVVPFRRGRSVGKRLDFLKLRFNNEGSGLVDKPPFVVRFRGRQSVGERSDLLELGLDHDSSGLIDKPPFRASRKNTCAVGVVRTGHASDGDARITIRERQCVAERAVDHPIAAGIDEPPFSAARGAPHALALPAHISGSVPLREFAGAGKRNVAHQFSVPIDEVIGIDIVAVVESGVIRSHGEAVVIE